jgi:dienelactone hydrolase
VIERAIAFGPDGRLVGIVAEPDAHDAIANAPAVLMWNVGIQHRVGPYRVQVDIARDLARRGFVSLRFDLSGMGDSEVRQDSRTDGERALSDARDAMVWLEKRRGVVRFLPIGFCSSVDAVHKLALEDKRVVGACFIEGYAYHTRGFWLRYPLRLLNRERWKRYVEHRAQKVLAHRTRKIAVDPLHEERAVMGSVFARQYPTLQQFGADVRALASRGTRMLFVYVGGDTEFNHRGQLAEMLGTRSPLDGVELEYYPDADHTFFQVADRRRLVVRVGEWVARAFKSPELETTVRSNPANLNSAREPA